MRSFNSRRSPGYVGKASKHTGWKTDILSGRRQGYLSRDKSVASPIIASLIPGIYRLIKSGLSKTDSGGGFANNQTFGDQIVRRRPQRAAQYNSLRIPPCSAIIFLEFSLLLPPFIFSSKLGVPKKT